VFVISLRLKFAQKEDINFTSVLDFLYVDNRLSLCT